MVLQAASLGRTGRIAGLVHDPARTWKKALVGSDPLERTKMRGVTHVASS